MCCLNIKSNIVIILLSVLQHTLQNSHHTCNIKDLFLSVEDNVFTLKSANPHKLDSSIYLLYDVNPAEGFNLRRDVYIRLSVLVHNLKKIKKYNSIKLVLPPFPHLYHWKSKGIYQHDIAWKHFFDMDSLKKFTDVLDYEELKNIFKNREIILDRFYRLKNFENMFEDGEFLEKYKIAACPEDDLQITANYAFRDPVLKIKRKECVEFQGSAMLLKRFLDEQLPNTRPFIMFITNAEVILHDFWGNEQYWSARRSMRFNKELVKIAKNFRLTKFNSTDTQDLVQRSLSWLDEKLYRSALGGNYLCAHLRRGDFITGRQNTTPSLFSAALQIKNLLKKFKLEKVFIASDCSKSEFKDLKNHLSRYKVVRYSPESFDEKGYIKDGGIAIIDQIICSHAKYFIGTYESTFTYRIYEEREILGFPINATFNTFCKLENNVNCDKNSIWPIVYP